ncbi:MAG: sterol desaturase family protein [bacterium]|nr:sterol desaturase family protein [bacterium]
MDIISDKTIISALFLAVLWFLELKLPFFMQFAGTLRQKIKHDLGNLVLGLFNAALLTFLIASPTVVALEYSKTHSSGVLWQLPLPAWLAWLTAMVLLDLWMYLWHAMNHKLSFLWRFHRLHHSDEQMNASTAVRFHTVEILLSGIARLVVLPLLGIDITQLIVYEILLLPVIMVHHSNVSYPRWYDFGCRYLLITPALHRVHHSEIRAETDSNYGSIFSIWDRIFGSFCSRNDVNNIKYGLGS